jgi:CheY-like chemotaxis protein
MATQFRLTAMSAKRDTTLTCSYAGSGVSAGMIIDALRPWRDPDRERACDKKMLSVLYVDDSPAQLDSFRASLRSSTHRVATASSRREAEDRMLRDKPDLVIIDYHMPDEPGDACLRALKPLGGKDTRYYLYTTDARAFRRYREMGFDGVFMLKGKSSVLAQIDAVANAMTQFRSG